jgi:CDP-glucose 4,6-dehydratase
MFNNCYDGKKVLITGHTGFKGSWLSLWLKQLGAKVYGASIEIPSDPSHFEAIKLGAYIEDFRLDIRDSEAVKNLVVDIQPDFVFHLAAQALVRLSYVNPIETITTNAIGTVNILEALRALDKPVAAVMITSDKAYDNVEWVWGYREEDRLGGKDPYSASKGMAELAIKTYVESFFSKETAKVKVGIARAGNVIGGGDWAEDRIVVDCMESWSKNKTVQIRSPGATRPWQHVLEPLSGYLTLGSNLYIDCSNHGEAYNFGPPANQDYSVRQLINEMKRYWENVRWEDTSEAKEHFHEAGLLKLNCDKALFDLNWQPTLDFKDTVKMTVEWYKEFHEVKSKGMYEYSVNNIIEYTEKAKCSGINWAQK